MSLLTRDEGVELARLVLACSAAAETEVTIDSVHDAFARFSSEGPTQDADRERVELSIRVRLRAPGGALREARVSCGSLVESVWRDALARAIELASVSPANATLLPLGGAVQVRETAAHRATLEHGFDEKARWIELALTACEQASLAPAGLVQTYGVSRTLANSAGRVAHGAISRASFALTASGPGGSAFAQQLASNVDAIDPAAVVERAVGRARRCQAPVAVEPGEMTVVLEPPAVSALVLFAAYQGFGAREVDERSSFLCGRIGERLFPPSLTLADDAASELYPGFAFDGEGTPKREVALIERGVLRGPVTDAIYAKKLGLDNTGHAQPQPSLQGPMATNLVLAPGDSALEDLVAGVKRGLLVSQLHYVNLIDPTELALTGTTRNGTFLIEDGKVGPATRNLRFTESLVRALANVSGVGRAQEVAGALFDGEVVTPALRIERFRFTSISET